jgi:sugar O-acyltransferase (sialic acid O-acetyltransferase NeuD family)
VTGLLIVGAGGHGAVVADAALAAGAWRDLAFVDDAEPVGQVRGRWPLLGPTALVAELVARYPAAVVAIGDAAVRVALLDRLRGLGYELPIVRHPFSAVGAGATLGEGTVVLAGAVVNAGASLGAGCIVNSGATVDHDCRLGDGVHVCPGAHLAGEVSVGTLSWLGVGCCVRQRIRIGARVTVGAGAAVVTDVRDGVTVVGVPAEEIKR